MRTYLYVGYGGSVNIYAKDENNRYSYIGYTYFNTTHISQLIDRIKLGPFEVNTLPIIHTEEDFKIYLTGNYTLWE